MKRFYQFSVLILTLVTLNGCAFFYSFDKDLDSRINQWLREHEYSKALDALEHVREGHSQYAQLQKRKKQVQQAAQRFEKLKLREISAHIEAEDWQAAESLLNYSMAKLPDSRKLHDAYNDFIQKRGLYLKGLYYQLYINKAEWLVKNKDVQEELFRTMPDDQATKKATEKHREEIVTVYQQLIVCGLEGQNIGDLELAEQCYLLANELNPSQTLQKTITEIQAQLARKQKKKALLLSERGRKLLESAKATLKQGDLKVTLQAYQKIPRKDKKHALVTAFKQELDARIRENVSQGIELGRRLYSQGQIEQALAIWNDIRELDPDNEYLISYIDRAQRVIEKLDRLKSQERTISPPGRPTDGTN
jgi:tetratricopeptide (TPR) repeat protein